MTAKSRGNWIDPRGSKITVRELGAEWLESNPAKRDSTWARDESALRVYVYPEIGDRTIGSLTRRYQTIGRRVVRRPRTSKHPSVLRRVARRLELRRRDRPPGEDSLPRHPPPGR